MVAVPGLVAKDGADGVYAAGLPDGSAVALKVADGSARPRAAIMASALELAFGVDVRSRPSSRQVVPAGVVVPGISGSPVGTALTASPVYAVPAAGVRALSGGEVSDDVMRAYVTWAGRRSSGMAGRWARSSRCRGADAIGRTEIGRQW